ncbi:cyclase family protein [Flexithrix dorotheae]|uniref:cyclase family protein n=1 Tax=Flexithrix dorotheae TaxID=70993 RepID=UPI001B7FC4EC|nr:cyclase family protein [Flexithrix dorotheae]
MMKDIIDLTMTYHEQMPGVQFETARALDKDGWNAKTLHLYSHAGTHMDAPFHFGVSNNFIDEFSPNDCIGKAWVVDVSMIGKSGLIEINHLEEILPLFEPGDSLLLKTGWSKYADQLEIYRNQLPRISEELAIWCVENQVKMLGVEPPSVADVNNLDEVTKIHQILLGGNVIIVEGLCNLDLISGNYCQFMALPLKIKNGDGAPCRAIAWMED